MRIRENNDYGIDGLSINDSIPEVTEYELDLDGELSYEDEEQLACVIGDDMIDKREAGLKYCHINDSDATWDLDSELDDARETVFRKLKHGNTVRINFFGDDELEESYSRKRDSYHRFLESYLDSLERRQERLR